MTTELRKIALRALAACVLALPTPIVVAAETVNVPPAGGKVIPNTVDATSQHHCVVIRGRPGQQPRQVVETGLAFIDVNC